MSVAPLVLWTQMIDQRFNFVVYVKVPNEPMKILLRVGPSKKIWDTTRGKSFTLVGIETHELRI